MICCVSLGRNVKCSLKLLSGSWKEFTCSIFRLMEHSFTKHNLTTIILRIVGNGNKYHLIMGYKNLLTSLFCDILAL